MIEQLAYDGRTATWLTLSAIFLAGGLVSLRRGRHLMRGGGYPVFPGREPGGRVFPLSGMIVVGWLALNLSAGFAVVAILRLLGNNAGERYAVPVAAQSVPLIHAALWFFWRLGRGTLLTARDERAIMAARRPVPPAPEGTEE